MLRPVLLSSRVGASWECCQGSAIRPPLAIAEKPDNDDSRGCEKKDSGEWDPQGPSRAGGIQGFAGRDQGSASQGIWALMARYATVRCDVVTARWPAASEGGR